MMKRLLIILLCLISTPLFAANGDITACRIKGTEPGDGWVLQIDIESSGGAAMETGGAYDFDLGTNNDPSGAKVTLTVTSMGYDTAGSATTITRTIYGTAALRKPYPNQATMNESLAGGTLTIEIALSDFVYAKDEAGGGKSGTDITAVINAGLYTGVGGADAGVASASWSGTVTNNSTLDYPSSVGRWAWVPYELVTGSTYLLEAVIFNRFAQNGKPLAAVKFTCTDEHTNSVTSSAVTDMTISTRNRDGMPKVLMYATSMSNSSFTDGDVITCDFTAYPWVGDSTFTSATAIADPDDRLTSFKYLYATNFGAAFVVVDEVNGQAVTTWDAGGKVYAYNTQAGAENAYGGDATLSVSNVGRAVQVCKDFNLDTYTRSDPGGCVILLNNGSHTFPGTSPAADQGAMKTWVTVQPMSTVTKAQALINACSSPSSSKTQRMKVSGVTVNSNCVNQFTGTLANTPAFWINDSTVTIQGTGPCNGWSAVYVTDNLISTEWDTAVNGLAGGAKGSPALFRGNLISTTANTKVAAYAVLGNSGTFWPLFIETGNAQAQNTSDGAVIAFNNMSKISAAWTPYGSATNLVIGLAIVQNVIETANSATGLLDLWSSNNGTSDNLLYWHNTMGIAVGTGGRSFLGYNSVSLVANLHKNWSQIGNIVSDWNNKDDTFNGNGASNTTSITDANPGVLTSSTALPSTLTNGMVVYLEGITDPDAFWQSLNGSNQTVANKASPTFTIVDTTTAAANCTTGCGTWTTANPVRIGSWPVGHNVGTLGDFRGSQTFAGEFNGLNTKIGGTIGMVNDLSAGAGGGDYHLTSASVAVNLIPVGKYVLPYDLDGMRRRSNADDAGAYTRGLGKVF